MTTGRACAFARPPVNPRRRLLVLVAVVDGQECLIRERRMSPTTHSSSIGSGAAALPDSEFRVGETRWGASVAFMINASKGRKARKPDYGVITAERLSAR